MVVDFIPQAFDAEQGITLSHGVAGEMDIV